MIDPKNPDFVNTPASENRPSFGYAPADPDAEPVVSVMTPFYNTGDIFHETARTVLNQSLQQWEWVIVNDGSTDEKALEVLNAYRDMDPRIRVIDLPENKGLSAARNVGYARVRAEYVFQLDSDDLIEPTMLEKCLWYLESHPACAFVKGYSVGFGHSQYLYTRGFHERGVFLRENLITPTVLLRKHVHTDVGGYDESNRAGLEDWDFWLRCAEHGHWGHTIEEFLDWYRRRPRHNTAWSNWDEGENQKRFHAALRKKYPKIYSGGFPFIKKRWATPFETIRRDPPCANVLTKDRPRLLMILPWMRMGGADKWNLDLVQQLTEAGWGVTILATAGVVNPWLPEFAKYTPDIFVLDQLVHPADGPCFIESMIKSRGPDVVMVTNSELGYWLLPSLRSRCPEPAYVDYTHMEEEYWKNGGHPRYSIGMQDQLDLNITASQHIKRWMTGRGADPDRIEHCYINVDPDLWKPDETVRQRVRQELGIGETTPVVMFAGRICPQKQPRVLARTLAELAGKSEFVALIAGHGEDSDWLEGFVKGRGLGRTIRLLGETSSDRVRELMAASDVFFLPSLWEGIALTIYEAMAMGLAIVGADVGGQKELVTPECGILLDKADADREVETYAKVLGELCADAERRADLGRAARQRIMDHFRLEQMGERMIGLFDRARELAEADPRQRLTEGLASELASRAVEHMRTQHLAETLWHERQHAEQAKKKAPAMQAKPRPSPQRVAAITELKLIERSRAWSAVQRVKKTILYRAAARMRWGPGWDKANPNEPPEVKLRRITNSKSWRLIQSVKRSGPYRSYAQRKYGRNWDRTPLMKR